MAGGLEDVGAGGDSLSGKRALCDQGRAEDRRPQRKRIPAAGGKGERGAVSLRAIQGPSLLRRLASPMWISCRGTRADAPTELNLQRATLTCVSLLFSALVSRRCRRF